MSLVNRHGSIRISLDESGVVRFSVQGLSPDAFESYRRAMDGAKYVRSLKASIATIDRVPAILVRLRKAGLSIGAGDMDPRLRTVLQERATARDWLELDAVKDRLARIERALKARGERLFPFQRIGVQWLARGHGRLLADDMGLGKSPQALLAMPSGSSGIVICPSGMKGDWKGFVSRWRPTLKATVLSGRKGPNKFRWPVPGEIVIVNYDILPDVHDRKGVTGRVCDGNLPLRPCPGCENQIVFTGTGRATTTRTAHASSCTGFSEPVPCPGCHPFLERAPRGIVLIEDEAQCLKNPKSHRHQRTRAIADVVRRRDGYVWALTGTPLENEPGELWAVLQCATVHRESFGSVEHFAKVFRARKLQNGGYEWGIPGSEITEHLQRVMLRRLKKDVQPQLPPKLRKVHEVELDDATYRRIESLLRETGRTAEEVVRLLELDKVGFKEMSSVRAALATAKIPGLLEIVREHEERRLPLIVFSDHRAPIDALGKRSGWVVITGSETPEQKTRAADEFQNGFRADELDRAVVDAAGVRRKADPAGNILYPRGVALTIKAGGKGYTFTRAAHMIFVDRSWNPQENAQAEDRNVRIGQTALSVDIMDVATKHPIDARVMEVIIRKMNLFEASINVAADRDMAGAEAELMRQLREEQEAIAAGYAVRRGAGNARERGAWEALHTYVFDDARDERIASELAEQADTIGLSNKQWSLAIVITSKGRHPDEPRPIEVLSPPVIAKRASPSAPPPEVVAESSAPPPEVVAESTPSRSESPTRTLTPLERRRREWARRI